MQCSRICGWFAEGTSPSPGLLIEPMPSAHEQGSKYAKNVVVQDLCSMSFCLLSITTSEKLLIHLESLLRDCSCRGVIRIAY